MRSRHEDAPTDKKKMDGGGGGGDGRGGVFAGMGWEEDEEQVEAGFVRLSSHAASTRQRANNVGHCHQVHDITQLYSPPPIDSESKSNR